MRTRRPDGGGMWLRAVLVALLVADGGGYGGVLGELAVASGAGGDGGGDYHHVIDQLARALSARAQSVANVSSFFDRVFEAQPHRALGSSWSSAAVHQIATPSYRPTANATTAAPSAATSGERARETNAAAAADHNRGHVPSQRLLSDLLVVRSSRRLYLLVLAPIHESLNADVCVPPASSLQPADCRRLLSGLRVRRHRRQRDGSTGRILERARRRQHDRAAARFEPRRDRRRHLLVGSANTRQSLRAFFGHKHREVRRDRSLDAPHSTKQTFRSDIAAIIVDDDGHFPTTNRYLQHIQLPIIHTNFPRQPEAQRAKLLASADDPNLSFQAMSVSMLPAVTQPVEALLDLLQYTQSTCVSVVHDESYAQ